MRTLPRNSLATWDDRPNYLGHPAPFYWVISLVLDRTLPLPAAILHVRLASAAFILAGLALTLAAGWRSFARHPAALATFSALTALCPKLIPVTDQVTNDALALAAGGLAYWSATRRPTAPTLAAAAVALTLACWSKPNAGLAIGAVLLLAALLDPRRRPARLTALAAGALLGAVPYLPILAKYGRLVPVTAEQFGQVHQLPGPAYLPAFLANLAYTFCQQQTGTWPLPDTPSALATALVWLFLLTILAAAWHIARTRPTAIARPRPRHRPRHRRPTRLPPHPPHPPHLRRHPPRRQHPRRLLPLRTPPLALPRPHPRHPPHHRPPPPPQHPNLPLLPNPPNRLALPLSNFTTEAQSSQRKPPHAA